MVYQEKGETVAEAILTDSKQGATYRIVGVSFGIAWRRLSSAFESSVKANATHGELEMIYASPPPVVPGIARTYANNTYKLRLWAEAVYRSPLPVVLMDTDTLVLRDLRRAFREEFDVAYTTRPGELPINAGVVFVNQTDAARQFMADWQAVNDQLLVDVHQLVSAISEHAGINQAALLRLLATRDHIASVKPLACSEWNSCDQTWEQLDENTAVLHVKGLLRHVALGGGLDLLAHGVPDNLDDLLSIWNQYDPQGGTACRREAYAVASH